MSRLSKMPLETGRIIEVHFNHKLYIKDGCRNNDVTHLFVNYGKRACHVAAVWQE